MNDKTFHITFESISDFVDQARKSMLGNLDKKNIGRSASFKNFNQFMNFMSPHKFTILLAIKTHRPKSIYEIAKITHLPQSCDVNAALVMINFALTGIAHSSQKVTGQELALGVESGVTKTLRGSSSLSGLDSSLSSLVIANVFS